MCRRMHRLTLRVLGGYTQSQELLVLLDGLAISRLHA